MSQLMLGDGQLFRFLSLFGEKEARILVLGLDNAGKTTILCELLTLRHIWMVQSPVLLAAYQPLFIETAGFPCPQIVCKWAKSCRPFLVSYIDQSPIAPAVQCMLAQTSAPALVCADMFVAVAAIGFNVETVTYKNIKFQVWDLVRVL
jgi:ADP-ribosylation factor family